MKTTTKQQKDESEARTDTLSRVQERKERAYEKAEIYNPIKQEGDTRTSIARSFVTGYFSLFAIIIVGIPVYNFLTVSQLGSSELVVDLNDILLTFSSVIGSALGFVIGYYFKKSG